MVGRLYACGGDRWTCAQSSLNWECAAAAASASSCAWRERASARAKRSAGKRRSTRTRTHARDPVRARSHTSTDVVDRRGATNGAPSSTQQTTTTTKTTRACIFFCPPPRIVFIFSILSPRKNHRYKQYPRAPLRDQRDTVYKRDTPGPARVSIIAGTRPRRVFCYYYRMRVYIFLRTSCVCACVCAATPRQPYGASERASRRE